MSEEDRESERNRMLQRMKEKRTKPWERGKAETTVGLLLRNVTFVFEFFMIDFNYLRIRLDVKRIKNE